MTAERIVAFGLAMLLIAVLLVLLAWAIRRRDQPLTYGETLVIITASVLTALIGVLTSLHGLGIIDPMSEGVRLSVIVLRGVATALYLGVLLHILGWPPALLRRCCARL